MSELPIGTLTLLFSDMEGSTRLLQQVGERYASVLADCRHLLRSAFAQHHGHEVDTQGDAFFVVFARATDAIAAAVAVQRALFAHAWPQGVTVRVRMGLHTGEPTLTPEGYVGLDVHHAARIMSAAHGGQILLSPTTRQLVEQHLPAGTYLQDLGQHRLKDLQRPDHLFQVSLENLPADFPPLKTLDASANNLPIQPTPFIGREKEVATVTQLFRQLEVRLVTLTGAGGMGKTRLALQVAAELVEQFADGVFIVALAPVSDAELVVPTVMQTLSIKEAGGHSPLASLKTALMDKQMLLLLDNFEQVITSAVQVAELLVACPKLKIMVTSRVVLHVQAEREFAVPPLSLPNPKRLPDLVALSQYEAVALFIKRAQAVKSDFAVTNANAPAVAAICARLDGMPLAIELAAARAKFFAPQALLARLEQGLALLVGGSRDLPARLQTLRGAIAWSYDLLSAQEQSLFRRLSVFVDGCTIEVAEVVCPAAGELEVDMVDGLLSLVDKSLLRQQESTEGEPRFRMLQLLREFGLERLNTAGEAVVTRRAHAHFFLTLAEQAEPKLRGPDQAACLERLEQEHENLRAALGWALEGVADDEQARERKREVALRISVALEPFWEIRGHLSDGHMFLERALASSEGTSTILRARVLRATAHFAGWLGDLDRAEMLARQSLSLSQELGETHGVADSFFHLSALAWMRGKVAEAVSISEERVKLMRQVGEPGEVAEALFYLADQVSMHGDYSRGQVLFEEALTLFRKAGNELWVGATLVQSATHLWYALGDPVTIAQRLQQGQVLISNVGDRYLSAACSGLAAGIALSEGELNRAYDLAQEALAIERELGARLYVIGTLIFIGLVQAQRGDRRAAVSSYQQSLAIGRELGERFNIPFNLEGLAGVAAAEGEFIWAAQLWGAAGALREASAQPLPPVDRASYEQAVSVARAQLGEQAFAVAWQEGRATPLEQVIDRALKMGDETSKQEQSTAHGATP
jgi:predicted ATPase/class 3 adenylate cyclase